MCGRYKSYSARPAYQCGRQHINGGPMHTRLRRQRMLLVARHVLVQLRYIPVVFIGARLFHQYTPGKLRGVLVE